MIESTSLNPDNIDIIIRSLRDQLNKSNTYEYPSSFIIPITYQGKINRNKYKGRGRPRREDYHRHKMMNLLKKVSKSVIS